MKKYVVIFAFFAIIFGSVVNAKDGLYVGGKLGFSSPSGSEIDFKDYRVSDMKIKQSGGASYGISVGYKIKKWIFEGEYQKTSVKVDSGEYKNEFLNGDATSSSTDVTITMLNMMYGVDIKSGIANSLYFGLGLGKITVASHDITFKDSFGTSVGKADEASGAVQLLLGVDGEITKNILWDARLQWAFVGSASGKVSTIAFEQNAYTIAIFTVGAKYKF